MIWEDREADVVNGQSEPFGRQRIDIRDVLDADIRDIRNRAKEFARLEKNYPASGPRHISVGPHAMLMILDRLEKAEAENLGLHQTLARAEMSSGNVLGVLTTYALELLLHVYELEKAGLADSAE